MPADHVAAIAASALPGVTSGDGGRDRVVTLVVLSAAPSVSVRVGHLDGELLGGTTQMTADLTGGRVAGLDFGQGSSQVKVTLPRPEGTTLVRLDGGASQLSVAVPAGVPARVTAGAGAGQVLLGGQSYTGIAGGTVLAQPGWAGAASRVDVDATTGASQISVTGGGAGAGS